YTPINFMLKPEEISQLIKSAKPRLFFVDEDHIGAVESIATELSSVEKFYTLRASATPKGWGEFVQLLDGNSTELEIIIQYEDMVGLFYTSGTESAPKGVMTSHKNIFYTDYVYLTSGLNQPGDNFLLSLPLIHIAGFVLLLNNHMVGLTVIMTETPIPEQMAMVVEKHKITTTALPPTLYLGLMEVSNKYDLSSFHKLITWSSTIPKHMVDGFNKVSPHASFFTIQGSSETTGSALTGNWFKTWEEVPNGDGRYVGKIMN